MVTTVYSPPFSGKDPAQRRLDLHGQLVQKTNELVRLAGPWTTIIALRKAEDQPPSGVAERIEELNAVLEEAQAAKNDARVAQEEAKKAAEGARVAAQDVTAVRFAGLFHGEAERTLELSKKWGSATGVLALVTIGAAAAFAYLGWDGPQNDVQATLRRIGFRVVALSVLVYSVAWCSRACLVNLHLWTVNKHRSLGIQTMQAFASTPADPAAKDAVVLQAARTVFEHVSSGYLGKRSPGEQSAPSAVDLVRSLRSGSS